MKFDPNSIPLRNMCKFLLKLEMKTRETYSIMIADTIEAMNIDLPQDNL